jgi:hypothetical protein
LRRRLRSWSAKDTSLLVHGACFSTHFAVGCPDLENTFFQRISDLNALNVSLHVLPVVVGMFIGAPLVARELEAGTFRFVWTQGIGRYRWLAAKLLLVGTAVGVLACAMGALAVWWASPIYAAGEPGGVVSRWSPGSFDATAVTLACWTVFSFAVGVLAGAVLRRAVPAMAATAASLGALAGLVYWKLDDLLTTIGVATVHGSPVQLGQTAFMSRTPIAGPGGAWVVREWALAPNRTPIDLYIASRDAGDYSGLQGISTWLAQHHDTLWWSFQPASRFWLVQALDGLTVVAASVLLGGLAIVWLRRRAA